MTEPRQLSWPDCLNARDLGGLPTADGRSIRPLALIRSDNHTRLTDAGMAAVRAAGVSRVLDLRSPAECDGDPSPFATESLYCNMPLSVEGDPYDPTKRIEQNYIALLDLRPELAAAVVGAIADAPAGGVAVHCHAGKDRAGNVVALTLSLAGVPAECVAADYAVLSDDMRALFGDWVAALDDPVGRDQLAEALTARPESILAVLQHLDNNYGGVEAYLRHGGLTTAQVDAVRGRLVA